jgi:hypothetical protein
MIRSRLHRSVAVCIAVLSLLLSQFALASYTCPGQADAAAMARMMASGQPCQGMDDAQPILCHQHAGAPAQASDPVKLPVVSLPLVVQVVDLRRDTPAIDIATLPAASPARAHPPWAPVFLSTLRLRV